MDTEIVARHLVAGGNRAALPDLDEDGGLGHGRGYRFLEKIIQSRLSIPAYRSEQMHELATTLVGAAEAEEGSAKTPRAKTGTRRETVPTPVIERDEIVRDSPELQEAILTYAPAYFRNPRRLKRYVNALRLHAYLAQASGFDASVDELARFLVLVEKWPGAVEALRNDPKRLSFYHLEYQPTEVEPRQSAGAVDHLFRDDAVRRLFQGQPPITGERLRRMCDWYGFRHYRDR